MDRHHIEYLPVITEEKKIAGFIDRRALNRIVSTKVMELQKQAEMV